LKLQNVFIMRQTSKSNQHSR